MSLIDEMLVGRFHDVPSRLLEKCPSFHVPPLCGSGAVGEERTHLKTNAGFRPSEINLDGVVAGHRYEEVRLRWWQFGRPNPASDALFRSTSMQNCAARSGGEFVLQRRAPNESLALVNFSRQTLDGDKPMGERMVQISGQALRGHETGKRNDGGRGRHHAAAVPWLGVDPSPRAANGDGMC